MNANNEVVTDGTVAIDRDLIVAVGTWVELRGRYPEAEVIGSPTAIVIPGMINAHQHLTGDRLVRSMIPDAISSHEAIFGYAVPIHSAHTDRDDELSALLSLNEALCNGITTTVEAGTVAHPEAVLRAMTAIGTRGTLGSWGWDAEGGPFAGSVAEVLDRQRAVLELAPPSDGTALVTGWVTLVGHDLMSDELVTKASELALDRHTHLTFHISPTSADVSSYLTRTGRRPIQHLHALGVLGPHLLLAHAVHVDDVEIDALVATDTAVASCPWAYLRLAQGVTVAGRHDDMIRRGVRVALGSDSENASDAIDPLRTGSLFVGLARDRAMQPSEFTAVDALRLLTIEGARAIGMADRIGSLEVGKQADLVVFATDGPEWQPRSPSPLLQLLWAANGSSVDTVLVAGRKVVEGRRCRTVDIPALAGEVAERQRFLGESIKS